MIEVEVKARAREDTKERIAALGATPIGVENHLDLYFNSPLRDFKSDEALRTRIKEDGGPAHLQGAQARPADQVPPGADDKIDDPPK